MGVLGVEERRINLGIDIGKLGRVVECSVREEYQWSVSGVSGECQWSVSGVTCNL